MYTTLLSILILILYSKMSHHITSHPATRERDRERERGRLSVNINKNELALRAAHSTYIAYPVLRGCLHQTMCSAYTSPLQYRGRNSDLGPCIPSHIMRTADTLTREPAVLSSDEGSASRLSGISSAMALQGLRKGQVPPQGDLEPILEFAFLGMRPYAVQA